LTGCKTKLDIYGEELEIESTVGWDNRAHFKPERLEIPFHWRKPRRIFVCSMSDLFHDSLTDEQIAAVFGVMAATPQHQYVVLTKRLQRAVEWFRYIDSLASDPKWHVLEPGRPWWKVHMCIIEANNILKEHDWPSMFGCTWPLPNVIICASVEDQRSADERVPLLLQIPAKWRGVSVEPMLEGIDLRDYCEGCGWFGFGRHGSGEPEYIDPIRGPQNELECGPSLQFPPLDVVICGAETGPGKRPFKDEWALDLRDQCREAGTPFFFKKDGNGNGTLCGVEYHEWPED
jgi:protein gp37